MLLFTNIRLFLVCVILVLKYGKLFSFSWFQYDKGTNRRNKYTEQLGRTKYEVCARFTVINEYIVLSSVNALGPSDLYILKSVPSNYPTNPLLSLLFDFVLVGVPQDRFQKTVFLPPEYLNWQFFLYCTI